MPDRVTISTFQLFKLFPDAESARLYFEGRLWPNGPRCPVCASGERITTRKGGFYRCNGCPLDFTVRTGTVMERSHVKLHHWAVAMGLLGTDPEMPSEKLARALGVTGKTAWLLRQRIHEATGDLFRAQLDEAGFRRLPGYEHAYRVGEDGSLWTLYRPGRGGRLGLAWRPLNAGRDHDGYRRATLTSRDGRQRPQKLAPLVCRAFHGPCPPGEECRHLDGIAWHDAADNLAWGTRVENAADRRRHGTAPVGEANGRASLTKVQIEEIRTLKGTMRQRDIAARFGITQSHVSRIQRGAQWAG